MIRSSEPGQAVDTRGARDRWQQVAVKAEGNRTTGRPESSQAAIIIGAANVGGGAVIEPGRQPAGYCSVASSGVASVRRCDRWNSICTSKASKSTGLVT